MKKTKGKPKEKAECRGVSMEPRRWRDADRIRAKISRRLDRPVGVSEFVRLALEAAAGRPNFGEGLWK